MLMTSKHVRRKLITSIAIAIFMHHYRYIGLFTYIGLKIKQYTCSESEANKDE